MIALPVINVALVVAAHVVAAAKPADNLETLSHGYVTVGEYIVSPHTLKSL